MVPAFVELSTSTEAYLGQAGGGALRHAQSRAPLCTNFYECLLRVPLASELSLPGVGCKQHVVRVVRADGVPRYLWPPNCQLAPWKKRQGALKPRAKLRK